MRGALHVGVLLGLACAACAVGSLGCRRSDPKPKIEAEPVRPPPVPPEVSRMISRISPVEFRLERALLGLLAKHEIRIRREQMNGQVVFNYYGQKLKLSPEKAGEQWAAARLYLDLDARIARRDQSAQAISSALGVRLESYPGAIPWDKAMAALEQARKSLDAALERRELAAAQRQLEAYRRALDEAQRFYEWSPNLAGSLPELLGFADLDRIAAVNGKPVRSFGDAYDALAEVELADRIDVDLERSNTPVHLTYHIVPSLARKPD